MDEVQEPGVYVTLQLDETTNRKTKKELQIRIIFWSKSVNRILNRHLITFFIDKGNAQTLFEYLMKAINMHNFLIDQVLTLGRDGPNDMKALLNLFQKELLRGGHKKLIDIGSCLLYVVNNAFMKGLECMSLDVSDVLIKLFSFFIKGWREQQNLMEFKKNCIKNFLV